MVKKILLAAAAASGLACAQPSAADVLSMATAVKVSQTTALTVTASQGDGTKLVVTKYSGASPHIGYKLTPGDGSSQTSISNLTFGSTVQTFSVGWGDLLCMFVVNPTAAAATVGGFGNVAPASVGYQCSTNVSSGGVPTGQTAVVAGAVTWP